MDMAHQVCILYAVVNGYLDRVDVKQIPEFERRLKEHLEIKYPDVSDAIRRTGLMDKDTENRLQAALSDLLADYAITV